MPILPSEHLAILEHLDDSYVLLDDSCEPVWLNSTAQDFCQNHSEVSKANEFFRKLGYQLLESANQPAKRICKYGTKDQEHFIEWKLESTNASISTGEYLLIGRGVTDSQRELLSTKSKLKHLATIINSEPSCVKTIGRDGELIEMNPAGLDLIEAPDMNSVRGVSVYELMEGESLENFKEFNRRIFEGESGSLDFEIMSLKGNKRHMRTHASPLKDDNGNVILHVAVTNDVTEEIEKTRQLRDSMEKAQAAAIAKGQFLANMSHEIRTPMNAVIGLSDLLLDTPLNEDQRVFAEGVHSSGGSLLKLIDDILDFSKIQAGKLEIHPRPSSIRIELASLEHIFRNQAETKGLNLQLDVSPNVPNSVVIDPDRFKQIVINLLGNAIKFTKKGEVGAKIDYIDHGSSDSGKIIVSVVDSGIGISEENKERIFESFIQGSAGINRDYGGTGLGLSISNQLIELMDGELEMESELGKGTSFQITIPAQVSKDLIDPMSARTTR
ncbi:MAG: two-component system sensor histidine kinase/response regulator, partial [Candidatus Pelagisphaera sp.]